MLRSREELPLGFDNNPIPTWVASVDHTNPCICSSEFEDVKHLLPKMDDINDDIPCQAVCCTQHPPIT